MSKLTLQDEAALRLPIGAFSPLWLMFAGAAATGAAFFWAKTWFKPVNLEALTPLPAPVVEPEPVVEAVELAVEAVPEVIEEAVVTVEAAADDLTKLSGIGAKLAAALAERGVTRFAEIAAWTDADIARFDKDLKLMGRVGREAWLDQARRFSDAVTH